MKRKDILLYKKMTLIFIKPKMPNKKIEIRCNRLLSKKYLEERK